MVPSHGSVPSGAADNYNHSDSHNNSNNQSHSEDKHPKFTAMTEVAGSGDGKEPYGSSPTAQLLRRISRTQKQSTTKVLAAPVHGASSHKPVTAWPVTVDSVVVSGNQRTKIHYFEKELQDAIHEKEDIIDLYRSLQRSIGEMQQQEIFDAIHVNVNARVDEKAEVCRTDIKVSVKEKGIPVLRAESYVRTSGTTASGSLNAELQGALRNGLGYGEVVRLSLGSNQTTAFQPAEKYLSLFLPKVVSLRKNPEHKYLDVFFRPYDFQGCAKISEENSSYFVGFKQRTEALLSEFRSRDGHHRFEIELSNRDELPVLQSKSTLSYAGFEVGGLAKAIPEVIQNAATSTKVSLKYGFTALNTLDSLCSPSRGSLAKGNVEIATPLGSAQFIKSDLAFSTHKSFGPALFGSTQGLTFSFCTSLGFVLPFGMIKNIFRRLPVEADAGHLFNRGQDSVHLSDR
jgi:outer membrane protein assembly factor BamA